MSEHASQNIQILQHLRRGRALSAIIALHLFNCFRLGARIWDLRKAGHSITTRMVETRDGKRIAAYRLERRKVAR